MTDEQGRQLYAGYRGDSFEGVWALEEWAERMGWSLSTAKWYASPQARRKAAEGRGRKFALGPVEDDG